MRWIKLVYLYFLFFCYYFLPLMWRMYSMLVVWLCRSLIGNGQCQAPLSQQTSVTLAYICAVLISIVSILFVETMRRSVCWAKLVLSPTIDVCLVGWLCTVCGGLISLKTFVTVLLSTFYLILSVWSNGVGNIFEWCLRHIIGNATPTVPGSR